MTTIKKIKDVTPRQKIFCDEYLETGLKAKSAKKAYNIGGKGGKTTKKDQDNTASSMAKVTLQKDAVIKYLKDNAKGASSRIVELSKSAVNEHVRLSSNRDILDRSGFKPKEEIELKSIRIDISKEVADKYQVKKDKD